MLNTAAAQSLEVKKDCLPPALEEAIAEAAYQLATCQDPEESRPPSGMDVAIAILQAIANTGGKEARLLIIEELAGYLIPFCALEIGSSEAGVRP